MLPLVFPLLAYDARVASIVGDRIFRFGEAPQRVQAPYITWSVVASTPENTLSELPVVDRHEVQIDCWSANDGAGDPDVEVLAEAVRDAIEPRHHMTALIGADRDPETRRYRVSMQFTFWSDRVSLASSVSETVAALWRPVYPIAADGIFDGAYIPNPGALWRVVSVDSPGRWSFYGGGGYIFNAHGAELGEYVLTYEVKDWDGDGSDQVATVTVIVE
jgi:hypothetical protein